MKTFSDLLATNGYLTVVADGNTTVYGLFDIISLDASLPTTINNYEILPKYQHLAQDGQLTIPAPFYSWYHKVAGQGWLLCPVKLS